jgi:hypothetical protein
MKKTVPDENSLDLMELPRPPRAAYQFKITLREVDPPVWRRVVVPSDIRLGKLHLVLQELMGWTNSHLHEYVIEGDHYGYKDADSPEVKSESKVILEDLLPEEGCEFTYLYDFGDGWEHDVVLEKITPWPMEQKGCVCLEGARACPPEDVGGMGGYEEFVKTMKGPDSEERKENVRWLGHEFDPEAFSTNQVNRVLAKKKFLIQ